MENFKKKDRTEFGHKWKWQKADSIMRGHWKSGKGNLVRVFPPCGSVTSWLVTVCDEENYKLTGQNAEQRAFAIAEPFTRQVRSSPLPHSI